MMEWQMKPPHCSARRRTVSLTTNWTTQDTARALSSPHWGGGAKRIASPASPPHTLWWCRTTAAWAWVYPRDRPGSVSFIHSEEPQCLCPPDQRVWRMDILWQAPPAHSHCPEERKTSVRCCNTVNQIPLRKKPWTKSLITNSHIYLFYMCLYIRACLRI